LPKKQAVLHGLPSVAAANAVAARQLTRIVAICEVARLLKVYQAKGAQADYEKN
jgi:hypothetical protein